MVRVFQGAFNAGIVAESMYARSDTEKFQKGLADAKNILLRPQGGAANRAGLQGVTRFDTSGVSAPQYLVPFAFNTEQTYQIEFSDDVARVIKDGAYVLDSAKPAKTLTGVTTGYEAKLTLAPADAAAFTVGELVYLSDPNGTHKLHNAILKVTNIDSGDIEFTVFNGDRLNTLAGDWGTLDATATIQSVYQFSHPYDLADMPRVRYTQDADTMYLAHPDYAPQKMGRADHDDWTISAVAFGTDTGTVTNVVATPTEGPDVTTTIDYEYVVSAIADDTFDEGLPSVEATAANDLYYRGSYNTITWDALSGAFRYNVYRKQSGSYGYVGSTTDTTFKDQNITPDPSRGVRLDRNPFDSAGNYPAVVSFYEQRLAYGATENDPQLVEMSRVANPENFSNSYPAMPDDAFRFRVRDMRVNRIRAFVPSDSLLIMTSGGEWEVAPQGDGEYVRPDKRKIAPQTAFGSADLEPLNTGSVVLFVEPSRQVVRNYLVGGNQPPGDLTVLATDLFTDRSIVSWAYAAAPDKLVWVVLDDGTLLTMTYMPEHDVWAWSRHEIGGGGRALQVSVIREGARDVAYVVVERDDAGGATVVRTVERTTRREDRDVTSAYFMDGGDTVELAAPASEVPGFLHLRGQAVAVLADGDVIPDCAVDETGTVSIGGRTAEKFSVGLGYEAYVKTLGVQMEVKGMGSTEGAYKATSELAVKLERSRGVDAGVTLDRMNPLKEWNPTLIDKPIPTRTYTAMMTVSGDWVRDTTTFVRQQHPLPMTVLAITPEWEIGG